DNTHHSLNQPQQHIQHIQTKLHHIIPFHKAQFQPISTLTPHQPKQIILDQLQNHLSHHIPLITKQSQNPPKQHA
ncbi:Rnase Y domain-containing protein, partial [Bacillus safensis]|uniref:Rnase Y domain-containing protein n=1 Tax=Bacillus safensis TaxID=561879 RepID=UPI0011A610AA